MASVPSSVVRFLSPFPLVGFSGSRSPSPASLAAVSAVAAVVSVPVAVGCARGVDECVRGLFPSASVFAVASGRWGSGRGAFAGRSVAFVRALAAGGGVLLSFPSAACPSGLLPSASSGACFSGRGSGSWASLAFALGLGLPCAVFLPAGVPCPVGWGLVPVGAGWFVPAAPSSSQLSLF
jgi:hypothetical protein